MALFGGCMKRLAWDSTQGTLLATTLQILTAGRAVLRDRMYWLPSDAAEQQQVVCADPPGRRTLVIPNLPGAEKC